MEDPWANAWGEPSKSTLSQPSGSNWSAPSVSTIQGDHEDDISTRSWSVEPQTHWDETQASLWSNDLSSTWQPAHSTFDTIPLSTNSISEESEKFVISSLSQDDTPASSSSISETPPISLSPPPKPLQLSRPSTPDPFGNFKGADEYEPTHESWSLAKPTFSVPSADADDWTPSWGESNDSHSTEEPEIADELDIAWETAKQQKERQDRHVPPELLASILCQLEEISGELWPDTDASTSASVNERSLDVEVVVPASITQRFMPDDITLPPNIQFSKTFILKQLTEALKLTKHSPQTHSSPMAIYVSSKGSTSWEASIKSQPNITHDDFAPAGWKIVEAAKESTIIDDGKKKGGSGLLSFFGRRTTASQSDAVSRPSSPPVNSPSLKTGSSPRASAENMTIAVDSSQGSGRTTPALPIAFSSSSSIPKQKNESNPVASSVTSDSIVREPTPPPSAVSRFLGRFSSRSSKPKDSLALSQDDLEFLSDVPTLNESESNHDSDLDALSMMIKSPPLMTPLAPPPRLSQTSPQITKVEMDADPFSIFNPSNSVSKHTQSLMKPSTAAPIPPVRVPLLDLALPSAASPLVRSRSTNNTQEWSSFGDLPTPVNGALPAKRIAVAVTPPNDSSTPPPIPKSQGSQDQWLGRDSLMSRPTGVISPLPPPPGSRSHTPSHTVSSSNQVAVNLDDDDFSEFLSSPPGPSSFVHNASSMNLTNSSSSVRQTSMTTDNIFDGFDDFFGPFSSDPQPPQLPAKPKPQPIVHAPDFPPPNSRRTASKRSPLQQKHSRTVSKADHSRTLSLLENVATRGPWFVPASPLPEALPPPASSSKPSSSDLSKYGSTIQAQQARTAAALSAPLSVDEKSHPQNSSHQPTSTRLFQLPMSSQPALSKPSTLHPSPADPVEVKSGGLSAQDLSFFEGL